MLIIATAGTDITSIVDGPRGNLHTPSINWSLCRHTVTQRKPGGGIICWMTSTLLVGEGGSDWVVDTPGPSVWGCQTNPPPKLQLWGLLFGPLGKGEVSPAATMGLEGCSTFSQPGNLFGGLFSAQGPMVISMVASLTGCWLVLAWCSGGWPPWVGWWGFLLEELCPWTHPHWRRRGSTPSLPEALSHSLPKGMV